MGHVGRELSFRSDVLVGRDEVASSLGQPLWSCSKGKEGTGGVCPDSICPGSSSALGLRVGRAEMLRVV